jgi:hypothetical protein
MDQQALRWGGTYTEWQNNVQRLRNFINQRCDSLTTGFMDCFPLTGPYNLVLNSDLPAAGPIKINSLLIDQFPWAATYYGGIDTKYKAMPNTGFSFDHWSSGFHTFSPGTTSDSVKINLTASDTITAHFAGASVHEVEPGKISVTTYPSVFDESFHIDYKLPGKMTVSVKLLALDGRDALFIPATGENMTPGRHSMNINLKGKGLSAGMYILYFVAGDYQTSSKLIYAPTNDY